MIYRNPPPDFTIQGEVVSCYCEHEGRILLLHRAASIPHGNKWGLPAGSVEPNETLEQAVVREVREETGLSLPQNLSYLGKVFLRLEKDYVFHSFRAEFQSKPEVILNTREHQDFAWVTPQEVLAFDLITDGEQTLKVYYDYAFGN